MFESLRRRLTSCLIVSAVLAVCGSAAVAQPGGGGGGARGGGPGADNGMMVFGGRGGMGGMMGGMNAPISANDIERIAKSLNLTADQKDAAKTLLQGYLASFQEKSDAARKEMDKAREDFRENRDPAVFAGLREVMTKVAEASKEMETSFNSDLKAMLTEEQAAQWPKYEMTRRRESTIRRGMMSGERVDLIRLVEQLNLEQDILIGLQPTLDAYAMDLDRELAKRNEVYEKGMAQGQQMMQAFQNGNLDMEALNKMVEEGRAASTRVRDVNRRYAKQIEASLPAEPAAKFVAEFKRESFPQIYRTRTPDTTFKAVEALEDLDEAQRAGIKSLHESYDREVAILNEKNEKATEEQEANFNIARMIPGQGGGQGAGGGGGQGAGRGQGGGFGGMFDSEQMQQLRTARRDLEKKTIDGIKAILTEAQQAKLPDLQQQGPGGGRNGGAGGQPNGGGRQQQKGRGNQPRNDPNQPPPVN